MSTLNKQPIRDFMQKHYTDARLAELLAHAQDGKLEFHSCCCFVGAATATHALKGYVQGDVGDDHYFESKYLSGAYWAEKAFRHLCPQDADNSQFSSPTKEVSDMRRRVLIPLIRAEMWRRAKLRRVSMAAELPISNHPKFTQGTDSAVSGESTISKH